jgi:hypothetical protein
VLSSTITSWWCTISILGISFFTPIGLELILLPIGQEVVDGVLQPMLVATNP